MSIPFVIVKGRLAISAGDTSTDLDDEPDLIPCTSGQVIFTPLVDFSTYSDATNPLAPLMMGNRAVTATLNDQGQIVYQGSPLIKLFDFTTDVVNPRVTTDIEATYSVSFVDIRAADGTKVDFPTFPIAPKSGVENELSELSPAPTGTSGIFITQGSPGRGIVSITRTAGDGAAGTDDTFTITYTDGSVSMFTIHNGADGLGFTGSITTADVSDAGTAGIAVFQSELPQDARAAIGAGTGNSDFSGQYSDLIGAPAIPSTPGDIGAVPITLLINGHALSGNLTLTAGDVGAVPTTRTVNGKALSANITLAAADVSAVPASRLVNGHALSSDLTLTWNDFAGTLPSSAIPPLAISQPNVVASQTAMLALNAQRGDTAIRTDQGKSYILSTDDPTQLINWIELIGTGAIVSVNGHVGVVALAASDVGAVPTTRTVNGKALSANITLAAADVSAMPATTKLNAIPLPTGPVDMNAQILTDLADPVGSQDAATKAYVDANAGGVVSLDYENAAAGTRFTMLYNGTTGFVNPETGAVAAARPSARTDIYFDLIGGAASVTDPAWMINGDAREITS